MESTPLSSLIASTFALESRKKNDSALSAECWTSYAVFVKHPNPTVFVKTAGKSSGVVFITASDYNDYYNVDQLLTNQSPPFAATMHGPS